MKLKEDISLKQELSVEQTNSQDVFVDYSVSTNFIRESVLNGLKVIGGITPTIPENFLVIKNESSVSE